jgi:5-methyltetrahydropteroyltriglutamate--homocysteine methyltransferase
MKRSDDRILSTHTGKLFMPDAGQLGMARGATPVERVRDEVSTLIAKQLEIGIDIVSNGEPTGVVPRTAFTSIEGIEVLDADLPQSVPFVSIERIPWVTREMLVHSGFYTDTMDRQGTGRRYGTKTVVSGPLKLKSLEPFESDIAIFKAVLSERAPDAEAFYCMMAPDWLGQFVYNEYYDTDEEFVVALAEVMAPVYKTVTDNGLILQIDDPAIATAPTEARRPVMSDAEYERFTMIRVEALNAALDGIPEEMIRFHVCWNSGPGMHTGEIPLKRFAAMMLRVKAQAFSIEAAKSTHRSEWKVWRDDLSWPADKIIIPGVVDHTTNVVEPAELIADQLIAFAKVCGRENVIAGTDCGMRGHAEANWAKYENIVRGAELASSELW